MDNYGLSLVIDLHNCNPARFNRVDIDDYFEQLCALINMEQCERFWWDDVDVPEAEWQTEPQLKGTSAVQFILTSSIVIHTLDELKMVYLDVFSCKMFDSGVVAVFSAKFFEGKIIQCKTIKRK